MKTWCICDICTCGWHRCPHLPTELFSSDTASFLTEYNEKFCPYGFSAVRQPHRAKDELQIHTGKMENTTTFRADYVRHKLSKAPTKTVKEYIQPEGDMMLDTTYSRAYISHPTQYPVPAVKPAMYRPSSANMDVIPTYKDDYRAWEIPKQEVIRTASNLKLCSAKFSNTTAFQDDYGARLPVKSEKSYKPVQEVKEPMPFDDLTNYKVEYVCHAVQPRLRTEKKAYKPQNAPFDGLTTHKRDYKGLIGAQTRPVKPKLAWQNTAPHFEASTEFQDKYKLWPVQPSQPRKSVKHTPPEGAMDTISTTHADFVGHQVQPPRPARPPVQEWKKGEPFDAQSTMKEDYRPWEIKKRSPIVQVGEIEKPAGPFESTTTFQAHYVPHTLARATNYKLMPTMLQSQPFNADTTYSTSYTAKEIRVCPASFPVPPGFEHEETDPLGHKLYRTISTRDNHTPAAVTKTTSRPNHNRTPSAKKEPARSS
nr:PREDICTED: stabilizer of axonemal microtubules 1 [Lepisosteus oculatus]